MDKKRFILGSGLTICYLVEREKHPELHYFLEQLKKDDQVTYKKTINTFDRLKDYPNQLKSLKKLKKLNTEEELWELIVSNETRFFLFFSAEQEICITHGYRKQRKNDKRLQAEINKAITIKQRYYNG